MGRKIADAMRREKHDVVLMDVDPQACQEASHLDCMVMQGHAASSEDLETAGIEDADVFYAVTSLDEVNLSAAAIAKSHGAERVFARVNSLDLMKEPESREFRPIGVDVAVSPDLVAASKITRLIEFPGILDMDAFGIANLRVFEARVEPGSPAAGRQLKDVRLPEGVNLVALFRGAEVIIPRGDATLYEGDHAVLVTQGEEGSDGIATVFGERAKVHESRTRPEDIVVAGATGVARRIAQRLQREGRRVTMVAQTENREVIEQMAAEMEGILVIEGSSRDVRVFREESLDEADVVVAASAQEEYNLITCLLARSLGVPRTMAPVDQPELEDLAERIGVDVAVSPRAAAVGSFLKYASELDPEALTLLHHGEAQVLLLEVDPGDEIAGRRLRDAGMPRGAVVAALIRGEKAVVPRGNERIQEGDGVVIFATTSAVHELASVL